MGQWRVIRLCDSEKRRLNIRISETERLWISQSFLIFEKIEDMTFFDFAMREDDSKGRITPIHFDMPQKYSTIEK